MSVFGSIVSAIFGSAHAASATAAPATTPSSTASSPVKPSAGGAAARPISQAELQGILEKLAASQNEKLDWKVSIVDLMKAGGSIVTRGSPRQATRPDRGRPLNCR